jgi:hypothetical protein
MIDYSGLSPDLSQAINKRQVIALEPLSLECKPLALGARLLTVQAPLLTMSENQRKQPLKPRQYFVTP